MEILIDLTRLRNLFLSVYLRAFVKRIKQRDVDFRLLLNQQKSICIYQTEICLLPNQSKKGKYNTILFTKESKVDLSVRIYRQKNCDILPYICFGFSYSRPAE